MSEPTVGPTRVPTLLLAAVCGLAVAVVARLVLERTAGGVPAPYGTALLLALLAAATYVMERNARERVQQRREPVEPRLAVTWLAMAKGGAIAAAFSVGLFGTWAVGSVPRLMTPLGRDRALHSGLAVLAAVALGWAALRLERACRIPPRDDEDDPSVTDRDATGAPPAPTA